MEGRYAPPKASHPFPNNPNMTKFWGPYAKGFFKFYGVYFAISAVMIGANMYLTRHEKGPWGTDVTMTAEEQQKQNIVWRNIGLLNSRLGLPLDFAADKFSMNKRMRFDDGVEFAPPKGDMVLEASVTAS